MAREVTGSELRIALEQVQPVGRATVLVGIDGRGASGKSTLARWLQRRLQNVDVVHADDFGRSDLAIDDWDWGRLENQVLAPLGADRAARYQVFDWEANELGEWRDIPAGNIIIVEGLSVLRRELGNPWDMRVWVEAPFAVRLARGVERDGVQMGDTWLLDWMPQEDAYVSSQKPIESADYIVQGESGKDGSEDATA
jgi:uridine kinase